MSEADIFEMMDAGLAVDLVAPFMTKRIDLHLPVDACLHACVHIPAYRHLAIRHVLRGLAPELYAEIEQYLGDYINDIQYQSQKALPSELLLLKLFNHSSPSVRLASALWEFRSEPEKNVRASIAAEWRCALVDGLVDCSENGDIRHIHDLDDIIEHDRTLAFDVLSGILAAEEHTHSFWDMERYQSLTEVLNKEERRRLAYACSQLSTSDLLRVLVGKDCELYSDILKRPDLKRVHLEPLKGSPSNDDWIQMALLALDAGYSAFDVSISARGRSLGGSGLVSVPHSVMWQGWIDDFKKLLAHADLRIKAVGTSGIEWCTAERDRELREEKRREVYGYFDR